MEALQSGPNSRTRIHTELGESNELYHGLALQWLLLRQGMEDSGASSSSGIFLMSACADITSVSQVTRKLYTIKFNRTNRLILCPILIKRKVMKVFRKESM